MLLMKEISHAWIASPFRFRGVLLRLRIYGDPCAGCLAGGSSEFRLRLGRFRCREWVGLLGRLSLHSSLWRHGRARSVYDNRSVSDLHAAVRGVAHIGVAHRTSRIPQLLDYSLKQASRRRVSRVRRQTR